ncbi:hypothetical protein ACLB1Q_31420 [Escherichia coli]
MSITVKGFFRPGLTRCLTATPNATKAGGTLHRSLRWIVIYVLLLGGMVFLFLRSRCCSYRWYTVACFMTPLYNCPAVQPSRP